MGIVTWAKTSIALIILAFLSVAVGHLALTDIYHANGDLSLEWGVLRVCFGAIVAAQLVALVTLVKLVRQKARLGTA